jgi:hypothetical protein
MYMYVLRVYTFMNVKHIKAQTYAAEAAGILADNAKTYVTDKMSKSKVFKFFGYGQNK